MNNVTVGLTRKKVLVLSDNEGLSRAIELNLNSRLEVKIIKFAPRSPEKWKTQTEVDDFDLIVLAMSSPSSEPVVALARASLTRQIGRTPLLIISDRPFNSEPEHQITHLNFPFDIDKLCNQVDEILQT
ncbi:MAG: hypothetical protein GY832_07685 [Chloroflexi bacterium]|nr:hypothetical protein [Chloroflexota bacterium]